MHKPLSIKDLWHLDRVGQISASPDGMQAVCTVTSYDLALDQGQTALWLTCTEGRKPPRRLTTAPGKVAQPAWSPRRNRIGFIGRREQQGLKDESPQLYLIAPDGGEAIRVTTYPPGIEAFRWLPDGQGVLFSAWVWPDAKGAKAQAARWKSHAARKESGHATSHAQVRQWDRHHPMDRVLHLHHLDLRSSRVTDLFEGTKWELPHEETSPEPFDASPDGRSVAFAFDAATEMVNGNRLSIAVLDLKTGKVRVVAQDPTWTFEMPRWSPNGRLLAMMSAQTGLQHTQPLRPGLIDPSKKSPQWRALGLQWDHEASSAPRWTPDGAALLLTAESRGRCLLWRCTPDEGDGRFEPVTDAGWVQAFDIAGTPGAETIVTVQDAHDHPPRVYAHASGQIPRRLERFNDQRLARSTLGRVEEVTLAGALGDPIQMWLTYPPDFDPRHRHPLMHVIHGGPYAAAGDTWSWRWNTHVLASQGHVVAQVNFHGSSGFGHAFKHSIMGRLAALEFVDIEAATDWLCRRRWVDPARVYAAGGSYGGFLVAWINGHAAAGRYRAHVCHAGVFDRVATFAADSWAARRRDLGAWYWEDLDAVLAQSPHARAASMRTPTLVIHGALDYRVPDCNGLAYYNTLKARGIDARLLWFPDENHWVLRPANSLQWMREFFAWLDRHSGQLPAP